MTSATERGSTVIVKKNKIIIKKKVKYLIGGKKHMTSVSGIMKIVT